MPSKLPALIGAVLALLAFFLIGLLPALTYGGYAGVLLAKGIFGAPLHGAFLENALVVFGAGLGVVGIGSLFAVSGAACGAAVGLLVEIGGANKARAEKAEAPQSKVA